MKAKMLPAVILLAVVVGAASAQAYQIRVKFTVRLRASYSLNSPVVGKALAGDVLNVAGRHNRWLKIERDGATAWLADWVEYARLDQEQASRAAEAASNPQQRSNIDNCCFVNRQCHSDREWLDGYWAYQRNECPAQPQSGKSSAQVTGHAIRIEASPLNVGYITEALNRLRSGSRKWYDYVINGADLIREDPNTYAGAALSSQRIILIPPYGRAITVFDMNVNLARTMAMLVHEACHIHHRDAGFVYNGYTKVNEEVACVEQETAALRDSVPPHLQGEHGNLGVQHCDGDLTNHPRCRSLRELCEWSADHRIISCPAIGLTRPSN